MNRKVVVAGALLGVGAAVATYFLLPVATQKAIREALVGVNQEEHYRRTVIAAVRGNSAELARQLEAIRVKLDAGDIRVGQARAAVGMVEQRLFGMLDSLGRLDRLDNERLAERKSVVREIIAIMDDMLEPLKQRLTQTS